MDLKPDRDGWMPVGRYACPVDSQGRLVLPKALRPIYSRRSTLLAIRDASAPPGLIVLAHPAHMKAVYAAGVVSRSGEKQTISLHIDARARIRIGPMLGVRHCTVFLLGVFFAIEVMTASRWKEAQAEMNSDEAQKQLRAFGDSLDT